MTRLLACLALVAAAALTLPASAQAVTGPIERSYNDPLTGDGLALQLWLPAESPDQLDSAAGLIVLSPDFGRAPESLAYLGEALAEAGYVVAAPSHPRGPAALAPDAAPGAQWSAWVARKGAVSNSIDAALAAPDWGSAIDEGRIAVVGHGAGAFAGLAAAGAFIDLGEFARFCRSQDGAPLCARAENRLRIGGQDPLVFPDPDDRIRAVIGLSPIAAVLPQQGLDNVVAPVRLYTGAGGDTIKAGAHADRLAAALPDVGRQTWPEAEHATFAIAAEGASALADQPAWRQELAASVVADLDQLLSE